MPPYAPITMSEEKRTEPGRQVSGRKDYTVKSIVGGAQVDAVVNIGAQHICTPQFVAKLGLIAGDSTAKKLQLPGGKQVLLPGVANVPFSFFEELKEYMLDCRIWVPKRARNIPAVSPGDRDSHQIQEPDPAIVETIIPTSPWCQPHW